MPLSTQDRYTELMRKVRDAGILASCASVLSWDESTYMPRNGSTWRGEQMGLLARLGHHMATDPAIGDLLSHVESSLTTFEPDSDIVVNVREVRRGYDRAVKVPGALVEELARASTIAQGVWRDAKKTSNFALFRPHLEKLVTLLREKADAIGHSGCRYDALLDEYEPGATTAEITATFTSLRNELVPLLAAIAGSNRKPRRDILSQDYPIERQRLFAESAAAAIGFDFDAGRLDESAHPFCSTSGPGDCRITTRYAADFFSQAFFGVLHEAGHALYEQGLPANHAATPLGTYCSLGIHESQSRLWENQIGRCRPFWQHFFPRVQQAFPQALRDVSLDDWMFAINDVQSSLIRVEADEATYNLHIILRFELEQAIIAGDLAVADIPAAWNEKFTQMLGLQVPDDAHGCLQDIHWSFGGMGYFATYTLGNLYAAQFMETMRNDVPGLEEDIAKGGFTRIKNWLNDNIHSHGQRYRASNLCRRVTGKPLNHFHLVKYLREKYTPLYTLS